jgi:hypothetical protein
MSDVRIVASMDDASVVRGLRRVQTTGEMSARTLNSSFSMLGRAFGVTGGALGTVALTTAWATRSMREYQQQYAALLPTVDRANESMQRLSTTVGGSMSRSWAVVSVGAATFIDYLDGVYKRAEQTATQVLAAFGAFESDPGGMRQSMIRSMELAVDKLRIQARRDELALEQQIREARARGNDEQAAALALQLEVLRRQQAISQDNVLDNAAKAELRDREAAIAVLEQQRRTAEAAAKAMKEEAESRLAAEKEIERTQLAMAQSRAALAQSRGNESEAEYFAAQAAFLQARAAAREVADPVARQELLDAATSAYEATQSRMVEMRKQEQQAAAEAIRLEEEQYRIELLRLQGRQKDADLAQTVLEFDRRRSEIIKNTALSETDRANALAANDALRGRFTREINTAGPREFTQARTLSGGTINSTLAGQVFGSSPAMTYAATTAANTRQTAQALTRAVAVLERIERKEGGAVFR